MDYLVVFVHARVGQKGTLHGYDRGRSLSGPVTISALPDTNENVFEYNKVKRKINHRLSKVKADTTIYCGLYYWHRLCEATEVTTCPKL